MSDNGNGSSGIIPQPIEAPLPALRSPELDAAATEAMATMGHAKVGTRALKALSLIGAMAEGVGMLRTQRGNTVVSQQWINESMRSIGEFSRRLDEDRDEKFKLKDKCYVAAILARAQAELARAMTDASKSAIESERVATGRGVEEPMPAQDFVPGEIIRPAPQQNFIKADVVHVHPQPEKADPQK